MTNEFHSKFEPRNRHERRAVNKLLRIRGVIEMTGLSKSKIYELIKAGEFPPGHLLSTNIRVWREDRISAWIDELTLGPDVAEH